MFDRLLYATDFSEGSVCALEFLRALEKVAKRVDVVHVITKRDFRTHTKDEIRIEEEECKQRLVEICQDQRVAGMEAERHLLGGDTITEILQAASDNQSTMIVVGTTGRHGVKELWLGSVSHRLAEVSSVPVLLVPMERAECYL